MADVGANPKVQGQQGVFANPPGGVNGYTLLYETGAPGNRRWGTSTDTVNVGALSLTQTAPAIPLYGLSHQASNTTTVSGATNVGIYADGGTVATFDGGDSNITFFADLQINGTANTAAGALYVLSANTSGSQDPDVLVNRNGSTINVYQKGPNITLEDTGASASASIWQNSGGQTEFWQLNSSVYTQVMKFTTNGSAVVGTATGGGEGAGTLNAVGLYVNGTAVSVSVGANPSASVGLSAVNGSATTWLRSDGAPALDQSIVPTWTGKHTFSPSSGLPMAVNAPSGQNGINVNVNSAQNGGYNLSEAGSNTWQIITGYPVAGSLSLYSYGAGGNSLSITSAGAVTVAHTLAVTGNFACNGASPPAQSTGWGTPTGGSVVNNFAAGATPSLLSMSEAVAQIITVLQQVGILGT